MTLKYRPEIDGLRAIAVMSVILFHAGFTWIPGGYVGVDVFFVISGYLITSILLREHSAGTYSLRDFYERRARRILPALYVVMAVCVPLGWWLMPPDQLVGLGKSMIATVAFVSNLFFGFTTDYFDRATELKPLLHTWSLGVEEQFYVVFPLLLALTSRWGPRRQVKCFAAIAIASLGYAEFAWRFIPDGHFYSALGRAWELVVGATIAYLGIHRPSSPGRAATLGASAGLALVLVSIFLFSPDIPFPGLYALVPTIGSALIIRYATSANPVGAVLASRPFVGIGLISYSAYLWHQPIFAFLRIAEGPSLTGPAFAPVLVLVLVLADLSRRYIERPFRSRQRIGIGALTLVCSMGAVCLAGLGAVAALTHGFPSRLDAERQVLVATAVPSPMRDACHTTGTFYRAPKDACTYFTEPVTWAAIGDSHAVEPAYALAELLKPRHQGVLHLSFSSCGPAILYDSPTPGCTAWQREALRQLAESKTIKNVLVSFRYNLYLFGYHLPGYPKMPDVAPKIGTLDAADARDLIWKSFTTIIDELRKSGKHVYVVGPEPELSKPILHVSVASPFRAGEKFDTGIPRAWVDTRNRYVETRMKALPWGADLTYLDPVPLFCDLQRCHAIIDEKAMYFDEDHFSVKGAERLLTLIEPYLGPVGH